MSASIELRALSKTFGSGPDAVHAFGPADLTIHEGEFVSLLGPSGCGKSTLMLIIAGLLEPSAGEVRVGGSVVTGPQTDIGIMFQDNTLVPWRTVWDNVALQLELRGLDVAPVRGSHPLAPRLGQPDRLRAPPSVGAFRRHAAARRLLPGDGARARHAASRRAARQARRDDARIDPPDLQALWMAKRPTVVFVTHSIEEAVQLSSRICVITPRPGRIDRVIDVDLPFPRTLEVKKSREFVTLVSDIQEIFHGYGVI